MHIQKRNKLRKIYEVAFNIQDSTFYKLIMVALIIFNTLVLSLDKYPVDLSLVKTMEQLNIFFTALFTLELLLKIVAVGFKMFFKGQWFNIFDTLIVIGSLVDIVISETLMSEMQKDNKTGSVVTALRGFRLLRVFKLAKTWKRFELLLETMAKTLKDVATFSILLFLFIFIFTLLGMELFAFKVKFDRNSEQVDLVNG